MTTRDPLAVSADLLAGEVCRLIDSGRMDPRSPAADALLDYAQIRHERESSNWLGAVRDRRLEILAARQAARA